MTKKRRVEVVEGVTIVSRHGVPGELRRMRRSVESLPPELRVQIVEYLCDSKVGNHYAIEVRSPDAADAIAPFLAPLRGSVTFINGREPIRYLRPA